MKKILLTNDDGIHSYGIRQLWEALADRAEVTVVAPAGEQSGKSMACTIQLPLMLNELHWREEGRIWSVSGTPVDCVKMALGHVMRAPPDIVASGINWGQNAGRNIFFSGTVGGVVEAALRGIPGIAFSCAAELSAIRTAASEYVPKIIDYALSHPFPPGTFLNVNFPGGETKQWKGCRLARQGKQFYTDHLDQRMHPATRDSYYWLGMRKWEFEEHENSDIALLEQGYITVVPIDVQELTNQQQLSEREEHFSSYFSFENVFLGP